MRYQYCQFGDKCRYFHPRRIKNVSLNREVNKTEKPFMNEERPTYASVVRKPVQSQIQPNDHFLGLTQPVHQNFNGQVQQAQPPFVGQASHSQQTFLEIQQKQKEMMEMFWNLNQKVTNMFNLKM